MIFYLLKALYTDERVTSAPVHLHYDSVNEAYFWNANYKDVGVRKFQSLEEITTFISEYEGFIGVVNNGDDIILPELLQNIDEGSISVEEMRYFEPIIFDPGLDSLYLEYHTRKDAFELLKQELLTI